MTNTENKDQEKTLVNSLEIEKIEIRITLALSSC